MNAIERDVQLNMLQKWMGHADMKTTAIYANAMGAEEQSIAARCGPDPLVRSPQLGYKA